MQYVRDLLSAGDAATGAAAGAAADAAAEPGRPATLLVIDALDDYDWKEIFAGDRLSDGRAIEVVQVGWDRLLVSADSPGMSNTPALVHVKPAADGSGGGTIRPDFVLVRNEARGATHVEDYRGALFGLMYAGIPAVNSLQSIYSFLERPIVQGELHKLQRRLGAEAFPVIPQSYFSSHHAMMYGGAFPAVLKVGHAHAGMGKMRVPNHKEWEDARSVVAMTDGKHCTAEPFIDGDFDLRIQKIGDHFRLFRRVDISGNWKTNTGCAAVEELPMEPRYRAWAEAAGTLFGGLDICTVDVIHERETGKEYILEVNGTSSGLCKIQSPWAGEEEGAEVVDVAAEDNGHIRELTLARMEAALCGAVVSGEGAGEAGT